MVFHYLLFGNTGAELAKNHLHRQPGALTTGLPTMIFGLISTRSCFIGVKNVIARQC
jgi:hypothetical protein